jgi:DDE superfamily endonuclease
MNTMNSDDDSSTSSSSSDISCPLLKNYKQTMAEREAEDARFLETMQSAVDEIAKAVANRKKKRHRSVKRHAVMRRDEHGNIVEMLPRDSTWYWMYVAPVETESQRFQKQFRRRFRMPYASFQELVELVKMQENDDGSLLFGRYQTTDAVGRPSSPIELMVLGSLRYLGRGLTFDDIAEYTCISGESHRVFFELFVLFGRKYLYPKFVVAPQTAEDAADHMIEMAQAGFNGCVGSMDATHVLNERICHAQKQSHMGFKLPGAARTYNITVNHRRQILSSTSGHPARWNDRTVVKYDTFLQDLRRTDLMQDVTFHLLERRGNEVIQQKYRGAWVMVDNGYLRWAITVPPFKDTNSRKELLFSKWLESLRKDVECTFGIMKGRWRILKAGIRIHGIDKADDIWHTCCALHNWLLDIDGLTEPWDNASQIGGFDSRDRRLMDEQGNMARYTDRTAIGRLGNDTWDDDDDDDDDLPHDTTQAIAQNVRVVRDLSLDFFRSRLVEHFSIMYERREVLWPSRTGQGRPKFSF